MIKIGSKVIYEGKTFIVEWLDENGDNLLIANNTESHSSVSRNDVRSYEECKEIANKMRSGEIEEYPIEVIDRDGFLENIVYLTFGLDGDMGFWKIDRLRDVYHLTSDKAIELISQYEQPKIYTLQSK